MAGNYFDVDWAPKFGFGGPRPLSGIRGVCVHTTENVAGTPCENVARYQLNSQTGSYHVLVDTAGRRLRENSDDWITWSTGNKGNNVLLHVSFVAQARWSRAEWLAQDRMLDAGASVVAHWCSRYNIPVRKVSAAGLPGLVGHADTRVWGGTDHTDPGAGFPWDVFISKVNRHLNGGGKEEAVDKNAADNRVQLRGPKDDGWEVEGLIEAARKRDPNLNKGTLVELVCVLLGEVRALRAEINKS